MIQQIQLSLRTNEKVPENLCENANKIIFGDLNLIDTSRFYTDREKITFLNGPNLYNILNFGPIHENGITFDRTNILLQCNEIQDAFSVTCSFKLNTSETYTTDSMPYDAYNTSHLHTYSYDTTGQAPFIPNLYTNEDNLVSLISLESDCGEEKIVDISYNVYQKLWNIEYKSDVMDISSMSLSANPLSFTNENVLCINCIRTLIHGINRRFMYNIDVYFNSQSLFSVICYSEKIKTMGTININPDMGFSGRLSYCELRDYIDDIQSYARNMYDIYSNKIWINHEYEYENNKKFSLVEKYSYFKTLEIVNMEECKVETVIPFVLYGSMYNHNFSGNINVNRSIFDFSKLNVLENDFTITFAGSEEPLDYIVTDPYDSNKDMLVIWVKVPYWNGQKFHLFYGTDGRREQKNKNPYKNYYGCWHMNNLVQDVSYSLSSENIFNAGEEIVAVKKDDKNHILQINNSYNFGKTVLYKSNSFDVLYDDRNVTYQNEEYINNFIYSTVKKMCPSLMEIRNIKSIYNTIYESSKD